MTLYAICPDCMGDGRHIKSKWGGNDPDTWDAGPCINDDCDNGEVPVWCSGCREQATEMYRGMAWCASCSTNEQHEDGLVEVMVREVAA